MEYRVRAGRDDGGVDRGVVPHVRLDPANGGQLVRPQYHRAARSHDAGEGDFLTKRQETPGKPLPDEPASARYQNPLRHPASARGEPETYPRVKPRGLADAA